MIFTRTSTHKSVIIFALRLPPRSSSINRVLPTYTSDIRHSKRIKKKYWTASLSIIIFKSGVLCSCIMMTRTRVAASRYTYLSLSLCKVYKEIGISVFFSCRAELTFYLIEWNATADTKNNEHKLFITVFNFFAKSQDFARTSSPQHNYGWMWMCAAHTRSQREITREV